MTDMMKGGVIEMLVDNPPKNGLDYLLRMRGISRSKLARELGVHPGTVRGWIEDGNVPTRELMKRAAQVLCASVEFLFFSEGEELQKEMLRLMAGKCELAL